MDRLVTGIVTVLLFASVTAAWGVLFVWGANWLMPG